MPPGREVASAPSCRLREACARGTACGREPQGQEPGSPRPRRPTPRSAAASDRSELGEEERVVCGVGARGKRSVVAEGVRLRRARACPWGGARGVALEGPALREGRVLLALAVELVYL